MRERTPKKPISIFAKPRINHIWSMIISAVDGKLRLLLICQQDRIVVGHPLARYRGIINNNIICIIQVTNYHESLFPSLTGQTHLDGLGGKQKRTSQQEPTMGASSLCGKSRWQSGGGYGNLLSGHWSLQSSKMLLLS